MNLNPSENNNHPSSEEEMTTSTENLWTTRQLATYCHLSLKTIYNLRKRGLPYVQLGGAVRFDPQKIRDYLANSPRLSSHRLRQMIRKGGRA